MSKFLDLIEAFSPVSRTIPKPSPGANAPMTPTKVGTLRAGAGMTPREVHELRDFLSSNGINSFVGGPDQPDVLKIDLDDGNRKIIVKVLPEEDGEQDAFGTAVQTVDRSADNPDDPAHMMSKQTRMRVNTGTTKANKYVVDRMNELDKQMTSSGGSKTI